MAGLRLDQPVEFVAGNLLVTPKASKVGRRRCWVGFEMMPTHYDLVSADRAMAHYSALTQLIRELDLDEIQEVHMAMVPTPTDPAGVQAELLRVLDGDAADYCRCVAEALAALNTEDDTCRFRVLLWLQIGAPRQPLRSWADARQRIREIDLGPGISQRHIEAWMQTERALRDRLMRFGGTVGLAFRALTRQEVLYFVRAPLWQGIQVPQLVDGWTPNAVITDEHLHPDNDMLRMYAGVIDHSSQDHLVVTQVVDGQSVSAYHAYLTVEQFSPNPLPILGGEWAYQLQAVGPVSVHIRWTVRSYEQTLADIASAKRKQADTADQEWTHGDGESAHTGRARSEVEDLEMHVRDTRSPSLMASVVIGVTAPTPEALRERIRQVTTVMTSLDITVVQNGPDQVKHMFETMPGAQRQVEDYVHRLLPPALATCMIGATDTFLDPTGTFIGVSSRGQPLWWDWLRPLAKLDTSGSMAFIGPMGCGKSTAANFLAWLAALYGAKVLAIDSAKPERSGWPDTLPYLGPHTKVVTLSDHEHDRGKLDPYVIFADRAEATVHAISQAAFLTQTRLDAPAYDVLLKAFGEVRDRAPRPCMLAGIAVLDALGRDPAYKYRAEAERLSERLSSMADMGYARLLFGDGATTGIDTSYRITVLQLDSVQRPPDDKGVEDYSSLEEYIGHAILIAAVAFASSFAAGDRHQQKIILADEIRWFVNNPYGRALIEKQTLIGRAMGTQVLLIGQNASHLPKDLHQHFTMRFAFGARTVAEAEASLEFLGVEATDENVQRLMALNPPEPPTVEAGEQPQPVKGQCLIRDLSGRVGQAQICLLFDELTEAFQTKSLTKERALV